MDEIKFTISEDRHLEDIKQQYLANLKKCSEIKELISAYHLDDAVILENISKFLKYQKSLEICKKCKDINHCQSEVKHCAYILNFDNGIALDQRYCSKTEGMYKLLQFFLYHDFPDDCFNHDFKDLYSPDFKNVRKDTIKPFNAIITNESNNGVYLEGNHLIGKTFMLGVMAYRYVFNNHLTCAFVSSPSIIKELNDLHFVNNETFTKRLNTLMKVDLLVLDDFGKEYKNEFIRDTIIIPLLLERLKNHLTTCFSSTYSLNDIKIMYNFKEKDAPQSKELISLIESLSQVIKINSLAYRE